MNEVKKNLEVCDIYGRNLRYYPICPNCKINGFVYRFSKGKYICAYCKEEFEAKMTARERKDYLVDKRVVLTYFIRKYLKQNGMSVFFKGNFEDVVNLINKQIRKLLRDAVRRAKANNRETVMEYDL